MTHLVIRLTPFTAQSEQLCWTSTSDHRASDKHHTLWWDEKQETLQSHSAAMSKALLVNFKLSFSKSLFVSLRLKNRRLSDYCCGNQANAMIPRDHNLVSNRKKTGGIFQFLQGSHSYILGRTSLHLTWDIWKAATHILAWHGALLGRLELGHVWERRVWPDHHALETS